MLAGRLHDLVQASPCARILPERDVSGTFAESGDATVELGLHDHRNEELAVGLEGTASGRGAASHAPSMVLGAPVDVLDQVARVVDLGPAVADVEAGPSALGGAEAASKEATLARALPAPRRMSELAAKEALDCATHGGGIDCSGVEEDVTKTAQHVDVGMELVGELGAPRRRDQRR